MDSGRERHDVEVGTCRPRGCNPLARGVRPAVRWPPSRLPTREQRRRSHLECAGHLLDGLQRRRSLATFQHGHIGDRDANGVGKRLL
jgi:hypothetical protein